MVRASPTRRGENQKHNEGRLPPRAQPELRERTLALLWPSTGRDGGEDDVSECFLGVAVLDSSGGGTLQEPVQMEVEPVRSIFVDVARVKNLRFRRVFGPLVHHRLRARGHGKRKRETTRSVRFLPNTLPGFGVGKRFSSCHLRQKIIHRISYHDEQQRLGSSHLRALYEPCGRRSGGPSGSGL